MTTTFSISDTVAASAASAPASAAVLTPANETLQQFAVIVCAVLLVVAIALALAWRYLKRDRNAASPETVIDEDDEHFPS